MQKSGCTAGCGCTTFKADAFKKEKCCNCFHNHYIEGAGGAKGPAPAPAPAAKKPAAAPAAASGAKCAQCDCTNFHADPFKKDKCSNCFHPHGGQSEAKPAEVKPAPPPKAADKAPADKAPAAAAVAEKAVAEKPAEKPARPEEKKAAGASSGKTVLKIAWHQSAHSEQYQIDVGDIKDLEQLDARLRSKEPSLANKKFEYLCRGQAVPKVFWDIFRPEHLFPTLFIHEESGDASSRNRAANRAAIPTEKKTGGFVPPAAGTGFAVPAKVTFQKPVVKVAGPLATNTVAKPKVGFKADDAWFASRPALFA